MERIFMFRSKYKLVIGTLAVVLNTWNEERDFNNDGIHFLCEH